MTKTLKTLKENKSFNGELTITVNDKEMVSTSLHFPEPEYKTAFYKIEFSSYSLVSGKGYHVTWRDGSANVLPLLRTVPLKSENVFLVPCDLAHKLTLKTPDEITWISCSLKKAK